MALTTDQARNKALEIVTAGLQSGSIKLHGPAGSAKNPKSAGRDDVEYLTMLIEGMAKVFLQREIADEKA